MCTALCHMHGLSSYIRSSWNVITHDPGIYHLSRCPESFACSEEWLVMRQRGWELSDEEKHDGVYSCLCPVYI